MDQIEVYCSKIEELNDTHPHVAKSIEKCALQAVTSMCQVLSKFKIIISTSILSISYDATLLNCRFGD